MIHTTNEEYVFTALCTILLCSAQLPSAAAAASANIERDIILTPNETTQLPGKILYFDATNAIATRATDNSRSGNGRQLNINNDDDANAESSEENFESSYAPWLEPLKHAFYLVLNHKFDGNPNESERISKQNLQAAVYHALPHREVLKFGDIIGMASGRLQINENGEVSIVELPENCVKLCSGDYLSDRSVSGVWSVEKIRHRDEQRGYRYELKITVRPTKQRAYDAARHESDAVGSGVGGDSILGKARSFILRDDDYPQYFGDSNDVVMKSERKENQRIEKRIFNILYDHTEIPFHLNYGRSPNIPLVYGLNQESSNLNTGEYYMGRPTVPAAATYHPRPLRFSGSSHAPNPLHNGNLHHHYYLNKEEMPIYKATVFDNGNIHGQHGPLMLQNHYPTIRNPQTHQHIENQIRANDYYGNYAPTPTVPVQFPIRGGEPTSKYRAGVRGPYDDNRENILDGEHQKYVVSPFDLQNNNLLNSPSPSKQLGHDIPTTPYVYQIDTSSPTPTPITYYSTLQQSQPHSHHSHIRPSSVYSSQQLANQLYWFGGGSDDGGAHLGHSGSRQQPRTPNVHFEGSYPFNENTFSELDPVYHGNSQLVAGNGPDQSVLVTPGNVVTVHPTVHYNRDSDRDASVVTQRHPNHAYTLSSEEHAPTQEITEPNYTTPYLLATTKTYGKLSNDGKPDSINAQLPPPDSDDDLTVPYVDASVHTEKPYSSIASNHHVHRHVDRHHVAAAHSKNEYVTTEKRNDQIEVAVTDVPNKMEKLFENDQRTPIQVRYKGEKSTSDKKSKWIPKRTRQRTKPIVDGENDRKEIRRRKGSNVTTSSPPTSTSITSTTTPMTSTADTGDDGSDESKPEIITAKSIYFHDEPRTSQSVKKTVSVHVGGDSIDGDVETTTSFVMTETTAASINSSSSIDSTTKTGTIAPPNHKSFAASAIGRSNVTRLAMVKRVDGRITDTDRNGTKRTRYIG